MMRILLFFFFISLYAVAQEPLYPTLEAGSKAPEIKGYNQKGSCLKLTSVKSRITLLYFYEVHCHLCETLAPELKKLYDSYHSLGLEIISIPVESSRQEWKDYLRANNFPWMQLFPRDIQALKADYLLSVSPTFYLLDKNKVLLTQRLARIEQVEEELNNRIR